MTSEKNITKCQNTFCKQYTKKNMKMIKQMKNTMKMNLTNRIKKLEKKKNKSKEEIDILAAYKLNYKEFMKIYKKQESKQELKKDEQTMLESCAKTFCNPDCKETLFDESTKHLPKDVLVKYKENNIMLNVFRKLKKDIFEGKKKILTDSFYNGMSRKTVKNIKQKGAISGCAKMVL
jgi:hypothetical protein